MTRRMLRRGGGGGGGSRGGRSRGSRGGVFINDDENATYPCRVRDKAFPAIVSSIIKGKRICGIQSS